MLSGMVSVVWNGACCLEWCVLSGMVRVVWNGVCCLEWCVLFGMVCGFHSIQNRILTGTLCFTTFLSRFHSLTRHMASTY